MNYSFVYGEKRSIINLEANIFSYITSKHILGNEINNIICYSEKGNVDVYYNSSEMEAQSNSSEKLQNKKLAFNLLDESRKTANEFTQFLQKIAKEDFSASSDIQLLDIFEKYFSLLSKVFSYYRFSRPELTDNLKEKVCSEIK